MSNEALSPSQAEPDNAAEYRLVVDEAFQLSILRRVAAYGVIGLVYVLAVSFATTSMSDPEFHWQSVWARYGDEWIYWTPGLLIIVPTLAVDMLRLTRRFASPMDRLRQEMRLLVEGKSEAPLELEPGDEWAGIVAEFNELREELLELRQSTMLSGNYFSAAPTPAAAEPTPVAPVRPTVVNVDSPPVIPASQPQPIDALLANLELSDVPADAAEPAMVANDGDIPATDEIPAAENESSMVEEEDELDAAVPALSDLCLTDPSSVGESGSDQAEDLDSIKAFFNPELTGDSDSGQAIGEFDAEPSDDPSLVDVPAADDPVDDPSVDEQRLAIAGLAVDLGDAIGRAEPVST